MTPYLHPQLPHNPKERKSRHHRQGKKLRHATSAADTLVSQVTPLLGITPHKSTQLQSTNTQEDIEEILGTRAFQRYVDTPIQTLDGIVVNQPKRFLPLVQEARKSQRRSESKKLMSSGLGYENNF